MKRPLILAVIAFVLADIICITLPLKVSTVLFVVALSLFTLSVAVWIITRRRVFFYPALIIGLTALSFSLFLFVHKVNVDTARSFSGYEGEITAKITRIEEKTNYTTVHMKTVRIGRDEARVKLISYVGAFDRELREGDYITLYGKISSTFRDSVMSDTGSKLAAQGIFAKVTAEGIEKANIKPDHIKLAIYKFRQKALDGINRLDNSGFVSALVIGTGTVDTELYEDFERLGLLHTISVSGMHLSIIVMTLYTTLSQRSFNKYFLSVLCIAVTLFYMALTGFSYPITRAGIMMIGYFLSMLIRRRNDSLTILFASLLFIVSCNPWSVTSVGLQLSFFSTLGILSFCSPIVKKVKKTRYFTEKLPTERRKKILIKLKREILLALILAITNTLSATTATFPLVLIYYGCISAFSFVGNITVIFIINALLTTSAIYTLLYVMHVLPTASVIKPLCNLLSNAVVFFSGLLAKIIPDPYSFSPETAYIIAGITAVILLLCFIFYRNSRGLFVLMLTLSAITLIITNGIAFAERNTAYITVSTSETCRDTLIEKGKHKTLLSYVTDDFSTMATESILIWRNVNRLDTAVFFVNGDLPSKKLRAICNACRVKQIILLPIDTYLPYDELEELKTELKGTEIEIAEYYGVEVEGVDVELSDGYISYSVNETAIIQALGGTPSADMLSEYENAIIIGDSDYYPAKSFDGFYLVSTFDAICYTEDAKDTFTDYIFARLGRNTAVRTFN
ncbi:MAG: ComEC/Rec2 family competence protein [Clostridia bacterium]|nr:ComEC/Rec2 family competence protein [Clostridia bacterium]